MLISTNTPLQAGHTPWPCKHCAQALLAFRSQVQLLEPDSGTSYYRVTGLLSVRPETANLVLLLHKLDIQGVDEITIEIYLHDARNCMYALYVTGPNKLDACIALPVQRQASAHKLLHVTYW